jgi:hypothetical protein
LPTSTTTVSSASVGRLNPRHTLRLLGKARVEVGLELSSPDSSRGERSLSLPTSPSTSPYSRPSCPFFRMDCSSTTNAEVLPPTVTHFIVAGSPDGCGDIEGQERFQDLSASEICTSNRGAPEFPFFFPFPHRCLNSQLSGNRLSSAFASTAVRGT